MECELIVLAGEKKGGSDLVNRNGTGDLTLVSFRLGGSMFR